MPILDTRSIEFISRSAEQTRRAGMHLGELLRPGDAICLAGELGAGKTTLVQGISAGWGSLDQVSSPTFVIINVYRHLDGRRLFHLDAYRLRGPEEAIDLDLDAYLDHGPLVIEWADRIQEVLPSNRLWVQMRWVDEQQRDLLIQAFGSRYQALLVEFREQVFGVK
jgi:tRNA threonylcarbamoyladenosine biosynthesis protein TsaE